MDGFVATSGPAGSLLDADGMIGAANENFAVGDLLEVAFHAEVGIADA